MALVLVTFTLLLWAGTALKGLQLLRAPDDRLLRTVASGLATAAIAFTVGRHPVEGWLDGVYPGIPSLVRNLGMTAAFYLVLSFFVYSAQQHRRAVGEMLRHRAIVGGLLALAVLTWALAPAQVRLDPRAASYEGFGHATVFQALAALATLYSVFHALRHGVRRVRTARRRHLRIGLSVLVIGLVGALLANLLSVVMTLMGIVLSPQAPALTAAQLAYVVVILFGIPGVAFGLAYPIVAGMVAATPVWWRHWRQHRALRPLWTEVTRAFPALTLRRTIGAVRPWSIHARRYRRACEIRDGLVMLAPYYPAAEREDAEGTATTERCAARLREALRVRAEARADGSEPVGGEVATVLAPRNGGGGGMDADIRWLVELSTALRRGQFVESG
ncbi:MAB_1171c family putative transporter [Actinopolyspora saharensis]|uniref:MAB_1171c family putative transporter n=1 Tax=Actinopolyspora saharensis TaxID=995062 RepID=UPI000ADE61F2|nr:MAB_1171c family putative transporter [Actinopolyspora saharensis]